MPKPIYDGKTKIKNESPSGLHNYYIQIAFNC